MEIKMNTDMFNVKMLWFALLSLVPFFAASVEYTDRSRDSVQALYLQKEGISEGKQGDFDKALQMFTKAYQLREKIYGSTSTKLASPLNNIGITYKNLGNFDKAIEVYKKVESLYLNSDSQNNRDLGLAYSNLGNIYRLTGDYAQALEYQKNAYKILKRDSLKNQENLQVCKINIAEINLKLKNVSEAIRLAEAGLKSISNDLRPNLYDLLAQAYLITGDYKLSEKNYRLAIDSWIKILGNDNVELTSEYLTYSSMLLSVKQYDKAYEYIQKSSNLVLKFYDKKSAQNADVLYSLGEYYYQRNLEAKQIDDFRRKRKENLKHALKYYQESIVALIDSFQTIDPLVNPPLENVISEIQLVEVMKKKALTLEKVASIYESEFNRADSEKYYKASLETYSLAIELIHRLQIGFESEDSKLFITQNQQQTFAEALGAAYKLYSLTGDIKFAETAFELSEKSKSSNLLASIKDVKAKEFGGIPDSLLAKEKDLKSYVFTYKSKLFEETHSDKPDTQKINLYSSKIFKYNEDYARLIDFFEKSYPQYFSLKYENKVVRVDQVQHQLKKRQALIEYFLKEPDNDTNKGELYLFAITSNSISILKEEIDQSFFEKIQKIHDFLIDPNYLDTKKSDYLTFSVSSFDLYNKLLKPLQDKINGKSLTIIPHDKLSYIPFDALISEKPDTVRMNFKDLRYVIRDYSINYGYSATLLFESEKKHKSKGEVLAFAPEYHPEENRKDLETGNSYFFSSLPGAKLETSAISRYMSSVCFDGKSAQESTFKDKVGDFDILHLAMHTIINDSVPMLSKLVFSKPEANAAVSDDGFLNAYEIYNMKLSARLAVLSACETGSGRLQGGEGVMSMARAFIYAGCPSVIMTLWKVDDKSGANIMSDFYQYLSKGKEKDVALRMAKLNHLEESDPLTAHPHFWLGYVSIGNPSPLFRSKDIYFVIVLVIVIVIGFADYQFRRRKKKMQKSKM